MSVQQINYRDTPFLAIHICDPTSFPRHTAEPAATHWCVATHRLRNCFIMSFQLMAS